MTSRWLRIPVLIYLCLWFGVIVPGHTRGKITLPGTDKSVTLPCCCAHDAAGDPGGKSPHHPNAPDRSDDCAICNIAARLEMPTVFNLELPLVGLLRVLPVLPVRTLTGTEFVPDSRGRDPPSIA